MKKHYFKLILAAILLVTLVLPNSQQSVKAATNYTATVNTPLLNVRKAPTSTSKKLGQLKKNTKVTVYTKNKKGWATINYKNKKAYVSAAYYSIL